MRTWLIAIHYIIFFVFLYSCTESESTYVDSDASNPLYIPEAFNMTQTDNEQEAGEEQEAGAELSNINMIAGMQSEAGEELQSGIESEGSIDESGGQDNVAGIESVNNLTMCERWADIWDSASTVNWTGSTQNCDSGTVDSNSLNTVLRLTNFYRELANLSPVVLSNSDNEALQECALMMQANDRLSHQPPESWNCYNPQGAYIASQSNLAGSNAVDAVGMYMIDPGNETTMGHRRWIMSQGLESIGVGSTSDYSCMSVLHLNRPQGWVAFPPPGKFPIEATEDRWGRSIDQTGWTIQYDGFSLANVQVSVKAQPIDNRNAMSEELDVELVSLRPNFGSSAAYNIIPQGWRSEVGKRYDVRLISDSEVIEYSVEFVDCGQ